MAMEISPPRLQSQPEPPSLVDQELNKQLDGYLEASSGIPTLPNTAIDIENEVASMPRTILVNIDSQNISRNKLETAKTTQGPR